MEEFEERLDLISKYNGIPYGRVYKLFDSEDEHRQVCLQFKGYLALSDAFKSLFLETVTLINTECRPKITTPLSISCKLFLPRLAHSFKSLCGSERIALNGYPYQAYTLLRNTFDNIVLASAALQGITDFNSIDGIVEGKEYDPKYSKRLRKKVEFEVRQMMTGSKSGLTQSTIDELATWDDLFDHEIHGARLSISENISWMKGQAPLPVLPTFQERAFAMFMNRYCEIAWLTHRLLPMMQPFEVPLGNSWKEKWRTIDEVFELMVNSLTKELGKKIGAALIEFVRINFPFDEKSVFPL